MVVWECCYAEWWKNGGAWGGNAGLAHMPQLVRPPQGKNGHGMSLRWTQTKIRHFKLCQEIFRSCK